MLFTQIEYFGLLLVTMVFLLLVKQHRARKVFLLGASYYFYAYWDWRFLGLVMASTLCDYLVGLGLERVQRPRLRKLLLSASLIFNLSILGFFKYYNFFVESFVTLLAPLGLHLETMSIILPVGISFYTFQTLSYSIDVYRRRLPTCHDILDFALFVGFFPQLVAGPIVRAADFLPQLTSPRSLSWERTFLGGRQFIIGLFKKVFIADRVAHLVDEVFANAGAYSSLTTWLAVLCYAIQIYCDFSGYSDMAIGTARILGFDLKENFHHPYLAASPADFWRRWHISLSTWLRDYLYIPLGGNRKGPRRTTLNLILTMVLGGLWHGAAAHFLVWGAWHGAALIAGRWCRVHLTWPAGPGWQRLVRRLGWATTLLVVLVGWVFFRAPNFGVAGRVLSRMFVAGGGVVWVYPFALLALAIVTASHAIQATRFARLRELPAAAWYTPVVLCLMVWLVFVFPPRGFNPFIYFQF